MGEELYWVKFGAISQALAAFATFCAIAVSLWIAIYGLRPKLKLDAAIVKIYGPGPFEEEPLLRFKLANVGERRVQVLSFGYRTGWLPFGPKFLKYKYAIQKFDVAILDAPSPPYVIEPGEERMNFAVKELLMEYSGERKGSDCLFSRVYPLLGQRRTRGIVIANLAGGRTIHGKLEPKLIEELAAAEAADVGAED